MKYFVLALLILSVAILSGPRVELDDSPQAITLPPDLDRYLAANEARFADIRPDTNKTILWADPRTQSKTPLSLIYLHGFAATRQEISPVPQRIAKSLGANLFYTRLSGHGRSGAAMADISVRQLARDAMEALEIAKAIGERSIVLATSTGATLATWLAAHDTDKHITALVLISPNYGLKRSEAELMLLPWGSNIVRLVEGENYSFKPINELQARYWTTEFPSTALLPMMALVKITREHYLQRVWQPVFIIYSPQDSVVSANAIETNFEKLGSLHKKLLPLENSGDPQNHVLAGDIMSPQTTDRVVKEIQGFLQQLGALNP